MAEPPATQNARPPKPARRQIVTRVESVERLTPGMLRIVVAGDDLTGFGAGPFTDHYVKLVLPPAGAPYAPPFDPEQIKAELPREQWPRMRTYTVRAWDPEANRLTLDFVVHGDEGLAGPWAAGAPSRATSCSSSARAAPTRPTRRPTGTCSSATRA